MKKLLFLLPVLCIILFSCDKDENQNPVLAPDTYSFERNGLTTISFSGQTTRIGMGTELILAMKNVNNSKDLLLEMFRNQKEDGTDANPFTEEDLNASLKSIKSKVAASADLFTTNTVESALIKTDIETWIMAQVDEVFSSANQLAGIGVAGQIADGTIARYVSAKGIEYDQLVNKALVGALMLDQMVNNYLSLAILDANEQIVDNDNSVLEEGKNYTTMEHKWDEAYGYLFGKSASVAEPLLTLGNDDVFFNKYLARVESDGDFSGIAQQIYDAFKLGRAAIVAKNYNVRNEQVAILQEKLSEVVAARAVYYLQQGKNNIPIDGGLNYGTAFHDLSEGLGFVYSLMFTRRPNSPNTYFTKAEVDGFIATLVEGNGFWDVTPETLDSISEMIAAKFDFTVAQAAE